MNPAPIAELGTCFLSYSRADEEFAVRLANDLRALGVEMWVDRFDIRPSEHWDRAIERAIRGCRAMVVILSPRSVASENVADEISVAIDAGKPVIPVMIEPCSLPLRLTRRHLIDATSGYTAALQQCFAEIDSGGAPNTAATQRPLAMQDPAALAAAERELTPILGPIAGILVGRVASRATSVEGLYGLLALHISNDEDRERFVSAHVQQKAPSVDAELPAAVAGDKAIEQDEVERVASALTNYVGPIAFILARKESLASGSIKVLLQRLAAKLPSACDRAAFLREMEVR